MKTNLKDGYYLDDGHLVIKVQNGSAMAFAPFQGKFIPETKPLYAHDVSPITKAEAMQRMQH